MPDMIMLANAGTEASGGGGIGTIVNAVGDVVSKELHTEHTPDRCIKQTKDFQK